MAQVSKPKPIERSIYFYKVAPNIAGKSVDLSSIILEVNKLPWADDSRRYWTQAGGDDIALWTDNAEGTRFRLAGNRRSGFPRSERGGVLQNLNVPAGSGLNEAIHGRVFKDGIVGFEFNFYGPRPSRLPSYLKHAIPTSTPFTLEALLNDDILGQLKKHKELRVVELQIRRGYASKVAAASKDMGEALKLLGNVSKADVVGLVFRPEKRAQTSLGSPMMTKLRKIAKLDGLRENAVVFKVKGTQDATGKVDEIDLLADHLVTRKSLVRQGKNSNAVQSESAFTAIEEAYAELKDDLIAASGVTVQHVNGK